MANGNKLIDQKAIDTIIDSILKAVEIKLNKKSSEGRGKDGKDGRDGKNAPQINDNEALSTNTLRGLKTQEEIAKVEGKIYPCTAQVLEDMSQEQQAELYTQGYRAIKTENNGTVVLLGLGSDGSLEWLGCNQPRGNLLDNPNFAIAQAGYNGYHGAIKYVCDRWTTGNANVNLSGKTLTYSASISEGVPTSVILLVQKIGDSKRLQGKNVTFAIKASGISVSSGEQFYMADSLFSAAGTGKNVAIQNGVNVYNFTAAESLTTEAAIVVWLPVATTDTLTANITIDEIAVYIGNYTPKTLPPWEIPTYMTELVKCLGRYQIMYLSLFAQSTYQAYTPRFNTLVAMMGTPTVTLYTTDKQTQGYLSRGDGTDAPAPVNAVNITNTGCNIQSTAGNFVAGKQYNGFIAFSYDL